MAHSSSYARLADLKNSRNDIAFICWPIFRFWAGTFAFESLIGKMKHLFLKCFIFSDIYFIPLVNKWLTLTNLRKIGPLRAWRMTHYTSRHSTLRKKKLQLTHFDSPNFSPSKENLEKIRKNEFSDFERWGKSTDKIGNKSGTFINKKW